MAQNPAVADTTVGVLEIVLAFLLLIAGANGVSFGASPWISWAGVAGGIVLLIVGITRNLSAKMEDPP